MFWTKASVVFAVRWPEVLPTWAAGPTHDRWWILAAAGIRRLERADEIGQYLDPPAWLPAVGQGIVVTVEDPEQLEHRRKTVRTAYDVPVTVPLSERGVVGVAGRGDLRGVPSRGPRRG